MPDEPKPTTDADAPASEPAAAPHRPPGTPDPSAPAAAEDPGKVLGIIGLVLVFFFPLIGLIVCLVAWNKSKKAGFKNMPAVIGIFLNLAFLLLSALITALLVVASFKGVEQRARITEQDTDVNYLSSQLERYYADKGALPDKLDDLRQLSGFDAAALDPPQGLQPYQYVKLPDGCTADCIGYRITAKHEDGTSYDHAGTVSPETDTSPSPSPTTDELRPIDPDGLQNDAAPTEEF